MRYQIGDKPIPGYKLEAFLGAGGYGEVWRASGPGGVLCALKFISLDSKSGLKEFRSIRLVKRLQHPNLCPVQAIWLRDPEGNVISDTGEDSISIRLMGPKELVIAMGLGQKSLAQRLEECRSKGGIPSRELLRYMNDAAMGIDYLNSPDHDLGSGPAAIIHCDIKPANLLIVGGGVQVCDYGVAKALAPDLKKTFAAGTPAYAPPELINSEPCPQTDQYSLAVTYYELRTGRLPYEEARAIVANLMGMLDFSGVNQEEEEVLRQATNKQPAKRFETCEEFVESLKVAAKITVGPSGVISAGQTRRSAPPPSTPELAPEPVAVPATRKGLNELLQPGGELVPDHFLTKLLGRGGYGEVWEARASGGVRCALKVVRDLQGRGRHEFAVLDKIRELDHPCLVQLRGYWLLTTDGTRVPSHKVGLAGVPDPSTVVISTDLAEKNLLDRLKECKQDGLPGIPPEELVNYVRQAAVALDYLNIKHHIQHRDVKPENLLLRGDRLLVSDFGLAKLIEGDGGAVQSSSSGMTLEYAAPEVLQKKVSSRTDQYSLALTYYTLRTGRMPFPPGMGQFDTMQARIKGQLDLSGIPEAEQAHLRTALSPTPADRFDSCEEMARQLAHASGVGTGPLPALPQGGPGTHVAPSRITADHLPSRRTPPAQSDPLLGTASTRSGHLYDTPRTTSRPDEVPLTPFGSAGAGTILFGDLPAESAAPPTTTGSSAPWVRDETPPLTTKTKPHGPQWNEDKPAKPGSGVGRTVALVGAVGLLLVLAAAGVIFLVSGGGTAVVSGTGTEPTSLDPDLQKVSELNTRINTLIAAKDWNAARVAAGELKAIDSQEGDKAEAAIRKAQTAGGTITAKDNRLADALKYFDAKTRDIPLGLNALDRVPEPSPDFPRARALQAAWGKMDAADGFEVKDSASLLKFRDEFGNLAPAGGSGPLTDADRTNLRAYYREQLPAKIRAAVPGLTGQWADVDALCQEAATAENLDAPTRDWLTVCRIECRAEQTLPIDAGEPKAPTGTPNDPALTGYAKYATMLRTWKSGKDLEASAVVAATLVPPTAPKADTWPSSHRLGRLVDLLWTAHTPLRTPDDKNLEHPYSKDSAEKAANWLTAASRAAEFANQKPADRSRIDYELLLAMWSRGQPADDALARLIDAKYPESLDPAPMARFGVILASARPAEAVKGYRFVLNALQAKGDAALRGFAARTMLKRLTTDKDFDSQPGADELLAAVGRELFRQRGVWSAVKGLPATPTDIAVDLFDRTAKLTHKARHHAWRGIIRAELSGVTAGQLEADLAESKKADGAADEPAVQLLEGIVTARMPKVKSGTRADLEEALIPAVTAADKVFRACLKRVVGDPPPKTPPPMSPDRQDLLTSLYYQSAVNAIKLANLDQSDRKRQTVLLQDAVTWADELNRINPERADGLDVKGCALEDQAWLLKSDDRFTADGGYTSADRTFADALTRSGLRAETQVHRARNLFKWAEDAFYQQVTIRPEAARLSEAEKLLTSVLTNPEASLKDATAAEGRYWLGRIEVLRYLAATDPAKPALYKRAIDEYTRAAALSKKPGASIWSDAVGHGLVTIHTFEGARLARKRAAEPAEAAAKALEAQADSGTPVGLPLPLQAKARAEAVRIRKRLDAIGAADWYPKLKDAIKPGLKECLSQDLATQFELRVMLAEATASNGDYQHNKPVEAIAQLKDALPLTKKTFLPIETRADLLGTLGFIEFQVGLADKKQREKLWADAKGHLDQAQELAPKHAKIWKWQYARSVVLLGEANDASNGNPARAATYATWALHLFRNAELTANRLINRQQEGEPDDLALAQRVWGERGDCYKNCQPFLKTGLAKASESSESVLWKLASAELDAASTGRFNRGDKERTALNSAIQAARAALPKLKQSDRTLGEEMVRRIEDFLIAIPG